MIIGLTGSIAAGKDTAIEYLVNQKKFKVCTISDAVKRETMKIGFEIKRENLQNVGNSGREKYGAGYWAKKILEEVEIEEDIIINGLRHPGEIAEIKKFPNSYILAVDAPEKLRYERMLKRSKLGDPKNYEDFKKVDERDLNEGKELGFRVAECIELADFKIINDETLLKFYSKLNEVYSKIKNS